MILLLNLEFFSAIQNYFWEKFNFSLNGIQSSCFT